MANTNFFKRLTSLWAGILSGFLTDSERAHPEVAYENAIDSMIGKYTRLRSATARIVRQREDLTQRIDAATRELAQLGRDLDTALDTGQEDLALMLVERKQALEKEAGALRIELDQARHDAEEAKASLITVKNEIDKLKLEKDRMLARMQSAQARIQINEQLEGLSVDNEVRALDTVRVHINNTIAEAKLGAELRGADLDHRLQKLRVIGASSSARAELESLKAVRAGQGPARVEVGMSKPRQLTAPKG